MKIKKSKWLKLTSLLAATGAIVAVPIITTSCGTSTVSTASGDAVIKKDATVVTNFESVLKGFASDSNMNKAISEMLTSENGKKQIIENYDKLANKEKAKVTVSNITQEENGWGGTTEYNSWKSDKTNAIVNNYGEIIQITSLKDLKTKLTSDVLTKLLQNAGVTGTLSEVKLVDTSKIGIEKATGDQSVIDAIHVNVQAKVTSGRKDTALENTTTSYNLAIPAVNLEYKIENAKVNVQVDNKVNELTTNMTIKFGTVQKIETNKENMVAVQWTDKSQDKNDVSMQELFKEFKWDTSKSTMDTNTPTSMKLDSKKIGEDLGLFNVEFSNPKDTTSIRIGNEGYKGMSFTLDAKPTKDFTWDDGSTETKTISINNMNVNIQDSMITYLGFSDEVPYVLEWSKIFPKKEISSSFPKNVKELQDILTNEKTFKEFQNAFMECKDYRGNFKAVQFTTSANKITEWPKTSVFAAANTEAKMEYKVVLTVGTVPGHIMDKECKVPVGKELVFKIVDKK